MTLASYYHGHALEEGSDAETVVRLLLGRVMEGLINLAGPDSCPIYEGYFMESYVWSNRVAQLAKPVVTKLRQEPFVASAI
jgi:hypothetical protein